MSAKNQTTFAKIITKAQDIILTCSRSNILYVIIITGQILSLVKRAR